MDARGLPSIEPQQAQRAAAQQPDAGQRHAHVPRFQFGELIEIGVHQVGQLEQQPLAFGWLGFAPGPIVERLAGRTDGAFDILFAGRSHPREHLAGRRIDAVKSTSAECIHPAPADEQLVLRNSGARGHGFCRSLDIRFVLHDHHYEK